MINNTMYSGTIPDYDMQVLRAAYSLREFPLVEEIYTKKVSQYKKEALHGRFDWGGGCEGCGQVHACMKNRRDNQHFMLVVYLNEQAKNRLEDMEGMTLEEIIEYAKDLQPGKFKRDHRTSFLDKHGVKPFLNRKRKRELSEEMGEELGEEYFEELVEMRRQKDQMQKDQMQKDQMHRDYIRPLITSGATIEDVKEFVIEVFGTYPTSSFL